uniref:Trafficking protein particle complex subunit 8 n=1 Tax=Lygus hesperus TaxID=30085 RepID=A0A146KXS3_LYGHE
MATSKTNPQDFIQETFAPMVAVATSPGVEDVCRKNNLEFVTLIKPFSRSTVEGSIKDPSGTSASIQPGVCFCDINTRPPPLNVARSYFNEALSSHIYERTTPFKCGNLTIDIPNSSPWFDAWRNTYLQVQYPSDHEFTKHYVGCFIMVSSLDQSPVEQLARITQDVTDMIANNNNKLPKWFGPLPSILIAYGFIHDNSVSHSSLSVPAFEAMKATYGTQKCFFLCVNSQDPREPALHVPDPWLPYLNSMISYKENQQEVENPIEVESAQEAGEKLNASTPVIVHPLSPVSEDPNILSPSDENISSGKKNVNHGMMLSSEDTDNLVQFVNEFCTKALIPHFEQLIVSLTDQVSNKKGVSRSLFSATKRLFGTNKPGTPGHQISPTAIAYSSDSHELQLRKLADLCFMIGLYTAAYNAYHSAKRDFYSDGAWLHYAGALEMASLAAFMTDNAQLVKKMIEYSEESISTYQTSCRYNPFATRATLLSSECLKGKGLYGEAAKQLIRMSGEDSDLRSAVLLEQAAYCFLHSARPVMFRKYAFHMVLAGNRYSKASHKNHSMRCYYQAYQVYESKNWSIAEDHILYTIGKHASQLKLTYNGFEALSALVKRSSRQIPNQQVLYFKDYIMSVKNMTTEGDEGVLSIPVADGKLIQVLLDISQDDFESSQRITASGIAYNKSLVGNYLEDSMWAKLEEKLVHYTNASNVLVFTPTVGVLNDRTKNSSPAIIVKGEPVGIRIILWNPLHIPVSMNDVSLLWSHISDEPVDIPNAAAISSCLPEVTLEPDSSRYIVLMLTPSCVGNLQVTALKYTLQETGSAVEGIQHLIPVPHSRIPYSSHETDQRLAFNVISEAPLLHVSFSGLKREFFSGEVIPVTIHLRNNGSLAISQIVLACSDNFELYIDSCKSDSDKIVFDLGVALLPNESKDIPAKIHPSWLVSSGTHTLNLLFYYTNGNPDCRPRYRLVRHSWPTEILQAYEMDVSVKKCDNSQADMSLNIVVGIQSTAMPESLSESMELYSIALYSQMWKLCSTFFLPQDSTIKNTEDIFILMRADKLRQPLLHTSRVALSCQNFDDEPKGFIPRLNNSLAMENEMLLIVSWRYHDSLHSSTSRIYGQNYSKISVCEENATIGQHIGQESLKSTAITCFDKPIDFRLFHDSFVENKCSSSHNNRSVVLSVTLKLLNRSCEPQSVKVIADCSQLKSSPSICSSFWSWQGKGLFEYKLEPYQDELLFLEAEFYRKGAYNLMAGIEVMAKINDEFVLQNDPSLSSVIIVK